LTDIPLDVAIRDTGASLDVTESSGPSEPTGRAEAKKAVFSADVGITGVDYAIAETGTVVLYPRKGLSRLVSLAPPTHIAVLRPGEVLESLDELFAMERDDFLSGEFAGSMNLISGPSKTGDIEGTIVTGIHGPLEVHLVILDNS
jgi:L-lactate dehydrogenase complex protein LldG